MGITRWLKETVLCVGREVDVVDVVDVGAVVEGKSCCVVRGLWSLASGVRVCGFGRTVVVVRPPQAQNLRKRGKWRRLIGKLLVQGGREHNRNTGAWQPWSVRAYYNGVLVLVGLTTCKTRQLQRYLSVRSNILTERGAVAIIKEQSTTL